MAKKAPPPKSNRSFVTIVAIVLVIGAAAIGYMLTRPPQAATVLDPNMPLPRPQGYVVGSDSAPVEIIEFADFECPGCGQFATVTEPDVMSRIVATGLARFRFVDSPIPSIHPNTFAAHNAGACANAQGRFWQMHDKIFYGQNEWSGYATRNPDRFFRRYAEEIGLDTDAFNSCLSSRQFQPQIEANMREAARLGVGSTPTFIVGKRMMAGAIAYDVLKALVDSATAEAKTSPPPPAFGDTAR